MPKGVSKRAKPLELKQVPAQKKARQALAPAEQIEVPAQDPKIPPAFTVQFSNLESVVEPSHDLPRLKQELTDAMLRVEAALKSQMEATEAKARDKADKIETYEGAVAALHDELANKDAAIAARTAEIAEAAKNVEEARGKVAEAAEARGRIEAESRSAGEARRACEAALAFELALVKDRVAIFRNGAFERPDDPKHIAALSKLLLSIGLEDSLLQGFPVAAACPPGFRTDWDRKIMDEVEGKMTSHIAELAGKAVPYGPLMEELEAALARAQRQERETLERQRAVELERNQVKVGLADARTVVQQLVEELAQLEAEKESVAAAVKRFQSGPVAAYNAFNEPTTLGSPLISPGSDALAEPVALCGDGASC